jgi:hypothetical protein
MIVKMNQTLQKRLTGAAWIWMFFMLMPAFQRSQAYTIGLDSSWSIALKMAVEQKLHFGQDFIFTYGSLGFLNTGYLPQGINYQLITFLFYLLIQVGFIVLIVKVIKGFESKLIPLLLAGLLFFPYRFISDVSFSLLMLQIGFLCLFLKEKKAYSLVVVSVITIIAFFVKLNLSLIMLIIWFGSLVYFATKHYLSVRLSIGLLALTVVLLFALAEILHTDLMIYLVSGVKLIDGYIDAQATMTDIQGMRIVWVASALMILVALFLWTIWEYLQQTASKLNNLSDKLYVTFLIAIALFLSYKQAFASMSSFNLYGFFLFFPAAVALLLLFESSPKLKLRIVVVILCSFLFRNTLHWYWSDHTVKGYLFSVFPKSKSDLNNWRNKKSVSEGIVTFVSSSPVMKFFTNSFEKEEIDFGQDDKNKRTLPAYAKEYLKKGSVDILPWEISYLAINQLNYNPRPIIQTYQAYSGYLDSLNAHKYQSPTAPDYLLYQELPYREQYFFWDEGQTKISILKGYDVKDSIYVKQDEILMDSLLVMEKRKNQKASCTEKVIGSKTIKTFETMDLPSTSNILFVKWNVEYSLIGKLIRIAFQPPYLYVNFTYSDGQKERFRVVPSVLKGGVIANKRVRNNSEAFTFFNTKGKNNVSIKSIKFETPYAWGFDSNCEVEVKEVIF